MARPGITYLDVSTAAQQLVAAGKAPTIETIRITLGTGSNSTLSAHLRTWKEKQGQTQRIATKENIPEELISALKGVWERVMDQSAGRIQVIQQETQQELAQLTQETQRLQKDNVILQQQYSQTKQEREGFVYEKAALEQSLTNAKMEIIALTEKLAGAEQQSREKQARIDELHRQNQQIQANLEHYRNASLEQRIADQQHYEHQQKQLEQTIQQTNLELAQTRKEREVFQKEGQYAHFEKDHLKSQLDKLNTQHELTTTHLAETLHELAKQTQAEQHWRELLKALQEKYDEQNKSFIELQTQNAIVLQQSESIKTNIKEIREQNKNLSHEKWILGQERSLLEGQLKQMQKLIQTSMAATI